MIWLTPLGAIIGAAIALPLLAAIYMLKLRRRPVRVSAASLWIEAAQDLEANVPLRWLRPSWLLLIQAIALALLALALGRPALPASGPAASRGVILLDVSASMRARTNDTGQTRFDIARERALELVKGVRGDTGPDAIAIVTIAAEPRAITPMTNLASELERALRAVEPTDEPGDLEAALDLASTLLQGAGESDDTRGGAIWIVSDGGFDAATSLAAPGDVAFISVFDDQADENAAPRDNIGLVALAARRDYQDPTLVRILATVAHADSTERAVVLRLTLDDREVERRALTLPASQGGELSERSLSFDLQSVAGGVLEASISPGGSMSADDRAHLSLPPASRPRLAWITPDTDATDPNDPRAWVLGEILDALDAANVTRLPMRELANTNADMILFDRVAPSPDVSAPSLAFIGAAGDARPPTRVVTWAREHPILRHAPLDSLVVQRPAALPPPAEGATRRVLARGRDAPLIVEDTTLGLRRILVAFDPLETDWPLQPGFPVFVASSVDYLTLRAERETGEAWRVGEAVTLETAAEDVTITDPDGAEIPTNVQPGRVTFRPARAGLYRARIARQERPIAVNLADRTETAARTASSLTISGRTLEASAASAGARELWRWLVLAAAALFFVEWLVYAARSRGLPHRGGGSLAHGQ